MENHLTLEHLFHEHGYTNFRWIDPREIVVAQWVRMKCAFGCGEYGHNASCPPNTPSVPECRAFFEEYTTAVILHFPKAMEDPEARHAWSREVNQGLVKLERAVFLAGFPKAFLLAMDSCELCSECTGSRGTCKHPRQARPSPEAMAVDVFSTVRKYGYPIQVLADYTQTMNRYAFLLVE
jgi:predicted metal-binding protein